MRTLSTLLVLSILMLAPLKSIQTTACAQTWQWGKTAVGVGIDSWPVATDASGNVFGGGYIYTSGTADFGGGVTIPSILTSGGMQAFWVKYDNTGTALWAGAVTGSQAYILNITTDPSGNLIVFGSFSTTSITIGAFTLTNASRGTQYYLAKISPSGTVLWAINDGNIGTGYTGVLSALVMSVGSVTTDPAGNIYITSSFSKPTMTIGSTTLTNHVVGGGSNDIFVAKYTPAGVPVWASAIGGTNNDYSFGVTVASTGDVYISGAYYSSLIPVGSAILSNATTRPYAYIAKFSSAGVPLWGQGEGGVNGAFAVGLAHDNYGNVYMTGGFIDNRLSFGSTVVSKPLPYPTDSTSASSCYIVQYSPTGSVAWHKVISGLPHPGGIAGNTWGFAIAMASCGQLWVSGNFSDSVSVDTAKIYKPTGGYTSDPVFIAGYNLSGGVVGHSSLGSGGDDQNGIAADPSGNVYMCSDYFSSPYFIAGHDTLRGTGGEDFYVAKYANTLAPPDTTYGRLDTIVCAVTGEIGITLKGASGYTNYFWNDSTTDSTLYVTHAGTYFVYNVNCGSSTFIDTFHVTFIAPADSTHSGHDTSVCGALGDSLYAPLGYTSYIWSTGSIDTSIFVSVGGYYVVRAMSGTPSSGCHLLVDSFHVAFLPPSDTTYKHINVDTCVAVGFMTIYGDIGYKSYSWSTGGADSSILVSTAGTYILQEVSAACDLVIDTFHFSIAPNDTTFASADTSVCSTVVRSFVLSAPSGYTSYLWSTFATTSSITVSSTGNYRVFAANGCKMLLDTFHVSFLARPTVSLGNDTAFCVGNSLVLTSVEPSGDTYLWSTGSSATSITVSSSGSYWLNITDASACTNTDTIHVLVSPIPVVNLGPDAVICPGVSATLSSSITYPTGTTYLWNTGATTSSISTSIAGRYWLQVTTAGCPGTDTISVVYRYDTTYTSEQDSVCVLVGSRSLTALWVIPLIYGIRALLPHLFRYLLQALIMYMLPIFVTCRSIRSIFRSRPLIQPSCPIAMRCVSQ